MRSTFKVLFYLKKSNLNRDGEAPIMARITIDGMIAQFSCKASIRPGLWETNYNRAAGRSDYARQINSLLDEIKAGIDRHYKKVLERDSYVTAEKVKNSFLGIDLRSETLLQVFRQHNRDFEEMKNAGLRSKSTYQKYKDVYLHLEAFIKKRYNRSDIALIELAPAFITDFELYLATVPKLAHNTIWLYMMPLRRMISIAINNRWLTYDPFSGYEIAAEETDAGYLDKDEIRAIMDAPLKKRLELVRDLFLFCVFTGLSFRDMKNLTRENMQVFFDGNPWIITRRQKTAVSSNVFLMDIPQKVIKKYEGLTEGDKLLPVPCYTTLETGIKEIALAAGIAREVTWHQSRHTYATEICLTNGVPIESLSKTMGHRNIKTTQRYAKITNEKVSRDMGNLSDVLQKIEQFKYR
ncbi:site-specific integrase [Dysgonomonas termitidis]|uniref:Site-specific integrase n=1 Tax=Dysgonomonas termitidis TaxID=1516126 RepID=A0ABV9KSX1_9BACT